jgi:Zn-dependent M16 (insulinase) family peptidase
MGTEKDDYVIVTQRISRKTGGINPNLHTSFVKDNTRSSVWLFLRGKAMQAQTNDLLGILGDILMTVRLDNRERFRQMLLEAKAREEQKLVPSGHQIVNTRLRSHFSEADWASEQMTGVSYLFFLRKLVKAVEEDWQGVLADLREVHRILINRKSMVVNVTLDEAGWSHFRPLLSQFLESLPAFDAIDEEWNRDEIPGFEGMTIPAQVNYVGKGINLYRAGYKFHGSAHVICKFLRNSWLWDRVRVQGGAYGALCLFDRLSGNLSLVSYRDPNIINTLEAFDESAHYLKEIHLTGSELTKGIIGSIGDMDAHMLPDAKGYTSMVRQLSGESDDDRQRVREEILGTKTEDFKNFAHVLARIKPDGLVKVLGSQAAIREAMKESPGWLRMLKVI